MSGIFLKLLNMSITASWLILAVILARLLLRKAPKWVPCVLWGLVAVRLICPFSLKSVFSLIPSSETVPSNIALQNEPHINSGITIINEVVNPVITESFAPALDASVNPLQVIIPIAAAVWIAGIVVMLAYALVSYLKLKKTVSVCVPVKEGILSCDEVKTPFILGVFRPVTYVPSSMQGETLDYVIRHETAHLQRRDHWWKPLGFLLLSVYWFNPLCWIAYILLCRDIEMACDEKVIRDMDKDDMAAYSQTILDCSLPRWRIAACPLAFGETGVKKRVKGVLKYKKPAFWIIVVAVAACAVIGVCFLTNPSGTVLTKWETDNVNMNNALSDVRSFSVRYWNYEVACNDAEMNRFIATMGKIKVGRKPVSKSRDEGRSTVFTITVNENLKLNFNERFDEIWVDNGVKPSYTYGITNPSIAEELLLDFSLTAETVPAVPDTADDDPAPYDLKPMIMVGGVIFIDTGRELVVEMAPSAILGEITSSVAGDKRPAEDGQSNFGCIGSQYAYYEDGVVVMIDHEWRLFEREDSSVATVGGADGPGSVTINIRTDVCELYLKVLEDLWNVDSGLNDGISQIGIDLSELSHLTELEKETVMHEFASKHSLPYIAGTWEELCEQGYIDKDNLYWEDGLFFSIKTNEDAAWSLPAIKEGDPVPELTEFDAKKWRSGLGAYFFGQCTAQKNADGKWSYTVGQEAIS